MSTNTINKESQFITYSIYTNHIKNKEKDKSFVFFFYKILLHTLFIELPLNITSSLNL